MYAQQWRTTYSVETQEPLVSSALWPFFDLFISAQVMPRLPSSFVEQSPSAAIGCGRLLARESLQAAVYGLGSAVGVAIGLDLAPGSYHVEDREYYRRVYKGGRVSRCPLEASRLECNRASAVADSSVC